MLQLHYGSAVVHYSRRPQLMNLADVATCMATCVCANVGMTMRMRETSYALISMIVQVCSHVTSIMS
jgi:hypothetical protein